MHPRKIDRAMVIIPAQMQAAMHRVQHELAQPVAPARPSLAPGNVCTNHDLPLDPSAPRLLAQVERQHVRRPGFAKPLPMQARHPSRSDHTNFQLADDDPFSAQHKSRGAQQRTAKNRPLGIDLNGQPGFLPTI
ncbi:hypothetical protein RAS2_25990 [Phycisphaerae bacterium RAS2]|nr:hypothetical protein RAS2_25990 [Phycisphaerae bacterium RAS2]